MGVEISDNFVRNPIPDGRPDDDQRPPPAAVELTAFLDVDEPPHDWVVTDLLERGDRTILTGVEGCGKSTLLRQIAVQLAAGIHPFTLQPITQRRVLLLDLENGVRHVRRKLRPLRVRAGADYNPLPGLFVHVHPQGLDLLQGMAGDGGWLLDLVTAVTPDLFIVGPTYKLATGDPTEEAPARTVAAWLDRIRDDIGCAVIVEAHSPYGAAGKRPIRPYGASLWSRWPEFGLHLSEQGQLQHWRGARDERDWPVLLQRGGAWPWTIVTRPRDQLWARIKELCEGAGDQLSIRDLAQHVPGSKTSVERAIAEHPDEWAVLAAPETREAE
jgi:hypothetical protein